jgi:hypothetical protein
MKNTAKFISAAGLSCMMAGSAWADLNAGLVAHYPFNGNAQDATKNGKNGTVHGATLTQDKFGTSGSAYSFDGNDYIITPDLKSYFSNTTVTISVWFKAQAAGVIIDELGQLALNNTVWHDSQIEILASGEVKVRVWNLSPVSLGTVRFGTWHHAVLRYNRATQKLDGFLDGVEASRDVSGNRSISGHIYYAFGAADTTHLGSGAYFKGVIDEVAIYNRALSADEVKQLYTETGLKQPCQLDVAAKLQEKQLEPDDNAIYRLTVTQTASCCAAKNVVAKVTLIGKPKGITLKPNLLKFGTLKPKQSVHKDLRVATNKAKPGKGASFSIDFDYECVYQGRGKDHKDFVIEVAED